MADCTIIYGEILSDKDREKITASLSDNGGTVLWKNDATLPPPNVGGTVVFVDLDKPQFANGEFLVSLATAGNNTKLIGKLDKPSLEESIRVAKYGVSEVISSDQCLLKLHALLGELEQSKPAADSGKSKYGVETLLGNSIQMNEIRDTISLLADVDFPSALILGPTGTGKSLISKILHNTGVRSKHNLVEVNCSAIPDELFESELFGHVKGAFTDAKSEKLGLFEYAQGGTLFLDEVGNLSASAQAKLLKILEDRKLRKVGTVDERAIDVRVVAATNVDLDRAIEEGRFRKDLFYRLNLLTLEIPPLKDRPEDIRALVEYYLIFYSRLYDKPEIRVDKKAIEHMQRYDWPGNVRELCNVIERATLLVQNHVISLTDVDGAMEKGRIIPNDHSRPLSVIPRQGMTLDEIIGEAVKQVLDICHWNRSKAAKILNISRPRLRRIIERTGVEQNIPQQTD